MDLLSAAKVAYAVLERRGEHFVASVLMEAMLEHERMRGGPACGSATAAFSDSATGSPPVEEEAPWPSTRERMGHQLSSVHVGGCVPYWDLPPAPELRDLTDAELQAVSIDGALTYRAPLTLDDPCGFCGQKQCSPSRHATGPGWA